MPLYTSIALDRLIESRTSAVENSSSMVSVSNSPDDDSIVHDERHDDGLDQPNYPKLDTINVESSSAAATSVVVDTNDRWTQISPALYATPLSTPIPGPPSSFLPSPYIINHKRRGSRLLLLNSLSDHDDNDDVTTGEHPTDSINVDVNVKSTEKDENSVCNEDIGRSCMANNGEQDSVALDLQHDGENDDVFVDPNDSMGVMSRCSSNVGGRSFNSTTSATAEFYDAWDELSSDSNGTQLLIPDIENELREIKLSLLMEIEKRKVAEETLDNMRSQWQRIREQLSPLGLTLPEDPIASPDVEESCQQVYLARYVSNLIGMATAKAEAEMEMEAQIKSKDTEIARLWDKLRYFEAVNQEMSQRNQQVFETARRLRLRNRRKKWVWGSVISVITLGSAVAALYLNTEKGAFSYGQSHTPEVDGALK